MKRKKYDNPTNVGATGITDQGLFQVISQESSLQYTVRFVDSGYTKSVRKDYIKDGSIKDPYFKSKCGVGFIGEGPYKTGTKDTSTGSINEYTDKAYVCWSNLIHRCYNPQRHDYTRYGARGVLVSEGFKNFQNFCEFFSKRWSEGLQLDKDILFDGNNMYSEATCVFVPPYINNLIVHSKNNLNGYPIGVFYKNRAAKMVNEHTNPYVSQLNGEQAVAFNCPLKAHKAWQEAKADKIFESVNRYSEEKFFDTRVADALLSKAWKLKTDAQLGIETVRL